MKSSKHLPFPRFVHAFNLSGDRMSINQLLSILAIFVGVVAALVSGLSWRASQQANRAMIFEQRFAVYKDAESFLGTWVQRGTPDIDNGLRGLVDAWNRSHFLFAQDVTDYLRQLWLDAIKANHASHVIAGEYDGDHAQAVQTKFDLTTKHCAEKSPLRQVFVKHMKI